MVAQRSFLVALEKPVKVLLVSFTIEGTTCFVWRVALGAVLIVFGFLSFSVFRIGLANTT